MAMMQWSQKLSVGVSSIDDQHIELIEVLNDLHAAMSSGNADTAAGPLLARLVEYTKEHFAFEEREMARNRYPGLVAHRREHENLLTKVVEFQSQLAAKKMALSVRLLEFLKDWLKSHILQSDRALGAFLHEVATRSSDVARPK